MCSKAWKQQRDIYQHHYAAAIPSPPQTTVQPYTSRTPHSPRALRLRTKFVSHNLLRHLKSYDPENFMLQPQVPGPCWSCLGPETSSNWSNPWSYNVSNIMIFLARSLGHNSLTCLFVYACLEPIVIFWSRSFIFGRELRACRLLM